MDWSDIRSKLHQVNKSFGNYSPTNFKIVEFKDFYRIYFLGITGAQTTNTLLYSDVLKEKIINESFKGQHSVQVQIHQCLSPNAISLKNQPLNRDQELLRERMRIRSSGITSYNLTTHQVNNNTNQTQQLIFTTGNQLHVYRDDSTSVTVSSHVCIGNVLHPQTCPDDIDLVAYVQDGDLYIKLISASVEIRLTHLRQDNGTWIENAKSAGVPSYIVQEEFDRFVGYWWRPQDSMAALRTVHRYRILFEETDESEVDVLNIVSHNTLGATVDQYRYPRPGTKNAKSDLKIIEFVRKGNVIEDIQELCLIRPLHALFPDMEYLLDAGWLPDGKRIYAILMNRIQTIKRTYIIPVKNFHYDRENVNNSKVSNVSKLSDDVVDKCYLLLEEKSEDLWLHTNQLLHFLKSDKSSSSPRKSGNNNNDHDINIHDDNDDEEEEDKNKTKKEVGGDDEGGGGGSGGGGGGGGGIIIIGEDEDDEDFNINVDNVDDNSHEDFFDCDDCEFGYEEIDDDFNYDGDDDDDDHGGNHTDPTPYERVDNKNNSGGGKECWVVSFICGLETSGYLHLHYITVNLKECKQSMTNPLPTFPVRNVTDASVNADMKVYSPRVVQNVKLTSGDWEVDGKKLWLDEVNKILYFVGYKDTPLETHLYLMTYERKGSGKMMDPIRITKSGYSNNIVMDEKCKLIITTLSSLKVLNTCEIYSILIGPAKSGSNMSKVKFIYTGSLFIPEPHHPQLDPPKPFEFTSITGNKLYGMVIKPTLHVPAPSLPPRSRISSYKSFSQSTDLAVTGGGGVQAPVVPFRASVQKYPVVLYVYGGPHAQMVSNVYTGHKLSLQNKLAQFGYAVVIIDNRGSAHRGYVFEGHLKNKLGNIEIDDQVEGLFHAAKLFDFIDLERVAIKGWSYGGYLSLMGLVQRPDVFKVAIAGAPVTSWLLYDTGYTERYLGMPKDNEKVYKETSVVEKADKFPNQEGRLLIVHGLMDENVHFYHTSSLVSELVKNGKPYILQTYPNERHGIRNPQSHEHYECLLISFLINNL